MTRQEQIDLIVAFKQGKTDAQMMQDLNLRMATVRNRRYKLGLKRPYRGFNNTINEINLTQYQHEQNLKSDSAECYQQH